MFKIRKALIALDLTDVDHDIITYFGSISHRLPVESIDFVHVIPKMDVIKTFFSKNPEVFTSMLYLDESIKKTLNKKTEGAFGSFGGKKSFHVMEGDPLEELLKFAEENLVDLIVLGHKKAEAGSGTLARNLVRKVKSNILVVPDSAPESLSHILVPMDFSKNSIRALDKAIEMNQNLDKKATVTLLNAYEIPSLSVYKVVRTVEEFDKIIQTNVEKAYTELLDKYGRKDRDHIRAEKVEKEQPNISRYIKDFAVEKDCDLIIIGAKGHSNVERLLLGSVTEKLLNINQSIPVLIVK